MIKQRYVIFLIIAALAIVASTLTFLFLRSVSPTPQPFLSVPDVVAPKPSSPPLRDTDEYFDNFVAIEFSNTATKEDAVRIAQLVNGTVVRPSVGPRWLTIIEVPAETKRDLEVAIETITFLKDPKILSVGTPLTLAHQLGVGFAIPVDPDTAIQEGPFKFYVDIVEVNFTSDATQADAKRIALLINGKITGFGPTTNLYEFTIPATTKEELEAAIQAVKDLNDPKIEGVAGASPFEVFP